MWEPGSVFLSLPPAVQLWPQNCTSYSAKQKADPCPTLWLEDHLVDMLSEVSPFLQDRGSLKDDFVQPTTHRGLFSKKSYIYISPS